MSAFEFFFSFYGLILGLSVAELLGGFARTLNRNPRPQFGLLTPLLAVFAALDVTTFWFQAWIIFRPAPFNLALLMLGLLIAGLFYIAATLVFPRDEDGVEHLDTHFWRNKRTILLLLLSANVIVASLIFGVAAAQGQMHLVSRSWFLWFGLSLFTTMTTVAALARRPWIVKAALIVLLAYYSLNITRAAVPLIEKGGWSLASKE
ncbi:MAG: hypothetical protein A2352_10610 [Caulobacterales bacterium RIFOXYB1_FULL_67_16]|nr:MAG: hypothetical protein A2352_10610 [Caulobacterales bacterium RIFOXYB1_FULL_67_16]